MKGIRFLAEVEVYLQLHDPRHTQETMFAEFAHILESHVEFGKYLKTDKEQAKMYRSTKLKEKRRMFINWYINANQGKTHTQCVEELVNILFITTSTINDIYYNYK